MGKSSNIRVVLAVFVLGCFFEIFTHDQQYTKGGVNFALEAILSNGSSSDRTKVIIHGIPVLMRIMFGGYGIVTAMRVFLPDQNRRGDGVMKDGPIAKDSDKRES